MKPTISNGGFFAAKKKSTNASELVPILEEQGYETASFPKDNIVLAAYSEFEGQGVWQGKNGGIAYDTDLTNSRALAELIGIEYGIKETGILLWRLYEKYGLDFIDKLRGSFGFALWDSENKKLVVVTDPFGIRPVVYSKKNGDYLAASRIRTLRLGGSSLMQINPDAIYHYLFFQAVCSPITIYKDVHKLEPGKGHCITQGNLKEFCHYDISYKPDTSKTEDHWRKSVFQEVKNAVNVFLPSSPVDTTGCFLSGGTDSSTIAGLYTDLSGKPAKTFSIGFDDPKYNELEYARIAVDKFGTSQTEYIVTPEDTLSLINELPKIYDEPFGNASVVAAYYCALAAKEKGVDVLLGGDGGDEIFGGNERYVSNLVFKRYHMLPRPLRKFFIEPLLKKIPGKGVMHKASRYVRRANFPNPDRFYSYNLLAETDNRELLTADFMEQVNPDCFINLARAHYLNAAPAHDTDRLLYLDMKFTITDNDLRKVTQMAESAGVRVRYPYLDRELVDFSTTIPADFKVKYGKNRYIFKRAMENFLPREIIQKSKHGMGLPISNWFRSEKILSEFLSDHLFSGKPHILNYIKPDYMSTLYQAFKDDENTSYYGDTLWVYLMLELWHQRAGSQL